MRAVRVPPVKFHVYADLRGEWRWRLVAENGRIMADSAEGYVRKAGVLEALDTLMTALQVTRVEIIED